MISKFKLLLILFMSLCIVISIKSCSSQEINKLKIVVIPKGEQTIFWEAIKKGTEEFAEEFNQSDRNGKTIEILWESPPIDDNKNAQISKLEKFLNSSNELPISGIVIAPLDDTALLRPIIKAKNKKIPVVIMDSGLSGRIGEDYKAFIATDNYQAGVEAGKKFLDAVATKNQQRKGNVWILGFREGSASTTRRERGFLKVITNEFPDPVYDIDDEGRSNDREAYDASIKLIESRKGEIPIGIFCANESTTVGMLKALQEKDMAGKIVFVGFDITQELYNAVKRGQIDALMVQDAKKIGQQSVSTMVKILQSDSIQNEIKIPIQPINQSNIDTENVRTLVESYGISP